MLLMCNEDLHSFSITYLKTSCHRFCYGIKTILIKKNCEYLVGLKIGCRLFFIAQNDVYRVSQSHIFSSKFQCFFSADFQCLSCQAGKPHQGIIYYSSLGQKHSLFDRLLPLSDGTYRYKHIYIFITTLLSLYVMTSKNLIRSSNAFCFQNQPVRFVARNTDFQFSRLLSVFFEIPHLKKPPCISSRLKDENLWTSKQQFQATTYLKSLQNTYVIIGNRWDSLLFKDR